MQNLSDDPEIILLPLNGTLQLFQVLSNKLDLLLVHFLCLLSRLFDIVSCSNIYDDILCIGDFAWDIERICEWDQCFIGRLGRGKV